MRQICFTEPFSKLAAKCDLLDDKAPKSAEFLWQLAQTRPSFEAMQAIWTGPELSCPLPASVLPGKLAQWELPQENATSFPELGEIVLAGLPANTVKGLPPGNFFDIGLFYDHGSRLLMPFGWIKANVCARVVAEDLQQFQASLRSIRRTGACQLSIVVVQ